MNCSIWSNNHVKFLIDSACVFGDIYPSLVCNTKVSQHFLPPTVVRETLQENKSHNCLFRWSRIKIKMSVMIQLVIVTIVTPMMLGDSFESTGYCYTQYVHVSVVKQVPSYSKHCTKVRNYSFECIVQNFRLGFRWMMSSARRRTKTPSPRKWRPNVLRHLTRVVAQFSKQHISRLVNYFDINMKTTVVPIDVISSCQECKTIRDVECRIVNIDKHGKYLPKVRWWQHRSHSSHNFSSRTFQKICTDVPTQKCVPVPVKVEAEKCVNIPTQTCQNVPVVANVPVPQKQCYRKPRWA